MEGWIAIHRKIQQHWIFQDSEKLKAWIVILLTAAPGDTKVNVGDSIVTCHRGQIFQTLESWKRILGVDWSRQKLMRFFKLLEADGMIRIEKVKNRTLLTVCNYNVYQLFDNKEPLENETVLPFEQPLDIEKKKLEKKKGEKKGRTKKPSK